VVTRRGLSVPRAASCLLAFALTLNDHTALAEGASLQPALSVEQTLQAERWGEQGVEAYAAGDYAKALDLLTKGFDLAQWNTIGVWLAKTLEKLEQPLEAYRIYADVAASPISADEPTPFAQAREEAKGAVARLEASLAVVELDADDGVLAINVRVDGEDRRLSQVNTLAVVPGTVTLEVRWEGGSLPSREYTLGAGQRQTLELGLDSSSTNDPNVATVQTLNFEQHGLSGWTLHDAAGKPICELPCRWAGTDVDGLSVRQGTRQLPVRLSRRHQRDEELLVSVNPPRGSKAWALGVGIPSAVLFLGSMVVWASEPDEPALAAVATIGFGASTGACAWWFIWSKNHPYLNYDATTVRGASPTGTIGVGIYGNTVGIGGTF
jgi:hypothetical protein